MKLRKVVLPAVLVAVGSVCFGQTNEETEIVSSNKDTYYEEYYVLKKDKRIRHGVYLKLDKPVLGVVAIQEVGTYSDGKKSGYWEVYYKGKNVLKESGAYKYDRKDSLWTECFPAGTGKKKIQIPTQVGVLEQIIVAHPSISAQGQYQQGTKIGVWTYYDEYGRVLHKYDFNSRQLVYYKDKDIATIECGFIGGEVRMYDYLYETFDFNDLMGSLFTKSNIKSGEVIIEFEIGPTGEISGIVQSVNTLTNKKIITRAMETVQSLDRMFYPEKIDDVPRSSKKSIKFELTSVSNKTVMGGSTRHFTDVPGRMIHMNFNVKITVL